MTKKTEKATEKQQKKFSKSAYLDAEKISKERLLLQILLEDEKSYTKEEVQAIVKNWKSVKVNKKASKEVKV